MFANTIKCSRLLSGNRLIIKEHGIPKDVLEFEKYQPPLDIQHNNSVLLKLVGAPVNHSDINFIQGVYPIGDIKLPTMLGFEGAFRVQEVGNNVKSFTQGDLVYLPYNSLGTWSDIRLVDQSQIKKIPDVFKTPIDAATFKINPFTAYRIIHDFESLEEGDVIVQNGATSHVGQAIVQIAKSMNIITVNIIKDSTYQEKVKNELMSLGASYVVTEEEAKSKQYNDIVGNTVCKAKLAINIVGDKSVYNLVKMLQNSCTVLTIGGVSMKPLNVPTSSLIFRNHKFVGFWLYEWIKKNANSVQYSHMEHDILEYYNKGLLRGPLYTSIIKLSEYHKIFIPKDNAKPTARHIFVSDF